MRRRGIAGLKFRRQQVIDGFIADFYCHQAKLVIEVDGDVHNGEEQKGKDEHRRKVFAIRGLEELRFRNEDVMNCTDDVVQQITERVKIKVGGLRGIVTSP